MDDFTKQIFPEGKERWIKFKYLDSNKVSKFIRFNSPYFSNDDKGFEVTSIGLRDEYTPQIEMLLELKKELLTDYEIVGSGSGPKIELMIDNKIEKLLGEITISK